MLSINDVWVGNRTARIGDPILETVCKAPSYTYVYLLMYANDTSINMCSFIEQVVQVLLLLLFLIHILHKARRQGIN